MAPVKRKTAPEGSPSQESKRTKVDAAPHPKKTRTTDGGSTKQTKVADDSSKTPKPTTLSLLAKEQPAFPRGGAGLLTPLERKQIQARANRDALAEQKAEVSDLFGSTKADDSDGEMSLGGTEEPARKSKKKSKKQKKSSTAQDVKERTSARIEGLKFKNITAGTLILGQIMRITSRELTVALPNNLVGYVPLTAISEQLNEHIARLLENDNKNPDEDEDDVDLKEYFHIGQYVRVAVTSTGDDSSKKLAKKRLELSLEPRLTNTGLNQSNLAIGCTVQVSTVSVEDHGIVVNLGLEDDKVRGFVPTSQLESPTSINTLKPGAILLCVITDIGSNGRTVKLSASQSKLGSMAKPYVLTNAPTVDTFLPGTAVEVLVSDITTSGIAGKVMGLLDVSADVVHSQAHTGSISLEEQYKLGKKIKGRLLYTFALSESRRLGFSLLPNILSLQAKSTSNSDGQEELALSKVVPEATVIRVEPGLGIYLELLPGQVGFAHVSRLADGKVDSISETTGPFKLASKHKARILDYNPIDDLFIVSLQEKVIEQPFLRIEDVEVGQIVKGKIGKILINENGINGLIVDLVEGIDGLVPSNHFSDIVLQHPEKKFREGLTVTARILSKDIEKRQLRLTLKKTLVNTDQKIWKDYNDIEVGDSTPGTLIKIDPHGALVQFYGSIKGYLPVAEMSEAYIKDAREHFRVGQVVNVTAVNINPADSRMTVSCRDFSSTGVSIETTLVSLLPGLLVKGTVFEKSSDDLLLRLEGSNAVARLPLDHVSDGSLRKRQSALAKIRVGQTLQDIVLLEVNAKRRLVLLCNRPSMVKASKEDELLKNFEDLRDGIKLTGFVTNITSDGIFVCFAAGITGLVPKSLIPVEARELPDFGMARLQPITAKVSAIDYKSTPPRFWLTMREDTVIQGSKVPPEKSESHTQTTLVDPADDSVRVIDDLRVSRVVKVRVISVKDTQINVELAKDIQGRIDVSEVFDSWDDIKDRKKPLRSINVKQPITARILGIHDARNHKFLPISHRSGKSPVYELSARPSLINDAQAKPVSMNDMQIGSSWLAFVNNVSDDCLWVNISPQVRGRIRAIDASDEFSQVNDLEANFPIGSALRVRVISVDLDKSRLDLSGKKRTMNQLVTMKDLSKGSILPAKITKVSEGQLVVQLGDDMVGVVDLIDMEDDYTQIDISKYRKNDLVRARVINVDVPNKKINVSIRPSKVLSSSLPVVDPEITSIEQINVNENYHGFISNVAEKGVFVKLGHGITAFVRVANLSDAYLKQWKDHFQRDQLVHGKITMVDKATGQVQMSLKQSVLDPNYKAPLVFTDMHLGDVVTGKVVKVETFGVFILVDNSDNVRGLCHRSEIAERRVEDATALFKEGDAVKAKVLKIELDNRRINFGMKASYFADAHGPEADSESEDEEDFVADGGVQLKATEDEAEGSDDSKLNPEDTNSSEDEMTELSNDSDSETEDKEDEEDNTTYEKMQAPGLGFDWHVSPATLTTVPKHASAPGVSDTDDEESSKPKKKKRRADIQVDQTGDLDAHGPQSADDFERLLLSEPDSSLLWIQYMALYIEVGDVDQARLVAERALKSIGLALDGEKMNVWVALLNLENAYGDPEASLEDEDGAEVDGNANGHETGKEDESRMSTLDRACIYNDPKEIYTRLASIYIQSGKHDRADALFQKMLNTTKLKLSQEPKIWTNYATFLFDTAEDADKGRALLPRALQVLPAHMHVDITSKFAQLEFRSKTGLPERGRTIFEGLLSSFPKRVDLFNVLLDLEMKGEDKAPVRALFERIFAGKVKAKQAKFFFKRWLAFEEAEGDERSVDGVKARAAEYVRTAGG